MVDKLLTSIFSVMQSKRRYNNFIFFAAICLLSAKHFAIHLSIINYQLSIFVATNL